MEDTNNNRGDMDLWAEVLKQDKEIEEKNKLLTKINNIVNDVDHDDRQKVVMISKLFCNQVTKPVKLTEEAKSDLRFAVSGGILK